MDRDLKNIVAMKETTGRKIMDELLTNVIKQYTDILTGDSIEEVIHEDLNKLKYNDYDVMRKVRNELVAFQQHPDHLINMLTDPTAQRDQSEEL